jgi:hypothetical protein
MVPKFMMMSYWAAGRCAYCEDYSIARRKRSESENGQRIKNANRVSAGVALMYRRIPHDFHSRKFLLNPVSDAILILKN